MLGKEDPNLESGKEYVAILNCRIQNLPFTYLGTLIGGGLRYKELWKPILSRL